VWGVIIPVAGLSVIGWFWFSGQTFGEAWNPQGLSLGEGMGSSIALTLWAFLGMESAAQNSDAVENPKRDVPLACMFGTLGAAVVYVLSTTVIQGIVPNAELAKSTGPFALAYAKMFNPTIGSIIMGLAVLACLGSLLGWQFTIGRTAKSAADERLFPTIFSKENSLGAPVAGMIVMGIVQTAMALSTISPSLSEQFSVLVNLAVVTNVVPYIISLSALVVILKTAGVTGSTYTRHVIITLIAMLYSTYAIYASGKDAVLGGTLVLALTYILYGFLAPRFMSGKPAATASPRGVSAIALATLIPLLLLFTAPPPASAASVLERAKASGKLTFGYGADARPFSYKDESGNPAGYAIALCGKIADAAKAGLGLPALAVEYVPVARDEERHEVGEADRRALGERVVERQGDDAPLGAHELGVQLGVDAVAEHGDVDEPVAESAVAAVEPHEPHGGVGVRAVPGPQHRRRVRPEGGPLVADADHRALARRAAAFRVGHSPRGAPLVGAGGPCADVCARRIGPLGPAL